MRGLEFSQIMHLWYHVTHYGFAVLMIILLIAQFGFNYSIMIGGMQLVVFLTVLWVIFTILGGAVKQKLEKDL